MVLLSRLHSSPSFRFFADLLLRQHLQTRESVLFECPRSGATADIFPFVQQLQTIPREMPFSSLPPNVLSEIVLYVSSIYEDTAVYMPTHARLGSCVTKEQEVAFARPGRNLSLVSKQLYVRPFRLALHPLLLQSL